MVAGSAVAHDYAWSVDKTPSTDKEHNVAGCVGLKYNNNVYSFKAEENDEIHVKVINDAISDIEVVIGKTSYKVPKGKAVELTHNVGKDVDVEITVPGTAYITEIVVESQAYRNANVAIEEAKEILNEANSQTASYAKDFTGFFTSVRRELNKQGAEIEKLIADLKGYKKQNTVGVNLAAFKSSLTDIEKTIGLEKKVDTATNVVTFVKLNGGLVKNAENAMDSYKAIVGSQNAKDAQAAIDNAKKTEFGCWCSYCFW